MRRLLLALKVLGGVILLVVALLGGAALLLNSDTFQHKALQRLTVLLTERLSTQVTIDGIHIDVFRQKVELYGIDVEDLEQRKMLQVEKLAAGVDLMALRHNEIRLTETSLKGCRVQIVKSDTDSLPNFHFVIDSLSRKRHQEVPPVETQPAKKKLVFDVDNVVVYDITVFYNGRPSQLEWLRYRHKEGVSHIVEVRNLSTELMSVTKKGPVDHSAFIESLLLVDKNGRRQLTIENLHYKSDNRQPRKNYRKPSRGFFDVGHLDVNLNLTAALSYVSPDSVVATLKAAATDSVTGINLHHVTMTIAANKRVARLSNVSLSQGQTTLKFDSAEIRLPSQKEGRSLAYTTSLITGKAVLQDISRPFAPVLSKFTQPLQLQTLMSGTDQSITFRKVRVFTPDKRLQIRATGDISNLNDARQLVVSFNVSDLFARGGSKEKIISQFPVKRMMMKQLHALGDIRYSGRFSLVWKKELFSGLLRTKVGDINFHFTIDNENKYVFGTANSDALEVDKTFDLPHIGVARCKADFKVDISKPRTAIMRRQKGGKLPIGNASIQVAEVKYKSIPVRNVSIQLTSDGAEAQGSLNTHGRRMDLACNFSFTSTDDMKKMKITSPGLKLHKLSPEDRQKKAEEKARHQQEREQRRLEKQQAKEQRKREKAENKSAKSSFFSKLLGR